MVTWIKKVFFLLYFYDGLFRRCLRKATLMNKTNKVIEKTTTLKKKAKYSRKNNQKCLR